jgi:hypothetical protein
LGHTIQQTLSGFISKVYSTILICHLLQVFHLIFVEAYFKSKIPRVVNGILCPTTNVATKDKKAVVVEG